MTLYRLVVVVNWLVASFIERNNFSRPNTTLRIVCDVTGSRKIQNGGRGTGNTYRKYIISAYRSANNEIPMAIPIFFGLPDSTVLLAQCIVALCTHVRYAAV